MKLDKLMDDFKKEECLAKLMQDYKGTTKIDEGYPRYKRRDFGIHVDKQRVLLDNRYVVPYNPHIFIRYGGHVNVECCNKSNSIKYLFKYVNKFPDKALMQLSVDGDNRDKSKPVDEIKQYYDCRYVSPCKSVWRIFAFDIHHKWPHVLKLTFHLHNELSVLYDGDHDIEDVVMYNKEYVGGRDLTYAEFPTRFTYEKKDKQWQPRKLGYQIGRILLTVKKGCMRYSCIKMINGHTYDTFQEARYTLGLLDDDREFIDDITENGELGSGHQLRWLFVHLLTTRTMTSPDIEWDAAWQLLSDDILFERRKRLNLLDMRNGGKRTSLTDFKSMPRPNAADMLTFTNKLIIDELNYNKVELEKTHIMESVGSDDSGFFFLYGYGGTGKTFIWKRLSAAVRSKGLIVLNAASNGIAALLLPGGRTAHSTPIVPIEINEASSLTMENDSPRADLVHAAKLIIWDEAPMMHRWCFEAVDRSLRDIMSKNDPLNALKPFGGMTVVLGCDFRQILPIVRGGTRPDIVDASVNL
ncbi:PIF1-like helicase [Medicago truncatula]|uniref:ATP-dependent DNA helicase n=1 Tax=Medicago truncatula TaxID=3880 RepID=A0A072TT28_MEDTR|nr:PIF1-like helicase [Medicago truncatula]